ncbi:MAG: hypothetical protein E6R06_10780 [Mycobacterium sp.]|jgi:hypothetical protein|nr:MAG: hypothetical protein E6R06_10780 [Mycobacterium sp.]
MFSVRTRGQIVALNQDLMQLLDNQSGAVMITASRAGSDWEITADGQEPVMADNRLAAIQAMNDMAVVVSGAEFFTAQMPPWLPDQP